MKTEPKLQAIPNIRTKLGYKGNSQRIAPYQGIFFRIFSYMLVG
jgi:hypothetical protein